MMRKTQETLTRKDNTALAVLCTAFELSHSKWKLGFSDGSKVRYVTIEARRLRRLHEEIDKAKSVSD
jgi:hypothetical protein